MDGEADNVASRFGRANGTWVEGGSREPIVRSTSPWGTVGAAIVAPEYHPEQHATWTELCGIQRELVRDRACSEFDAGLARIEPLTQRIPALAEAHRLTEQLTGWGIVRVDGYVEPDEFCRMLAAKTFPCMDALRPPDELYYTPSPDMFHDLMGHVPALCTDEWAELYYLFGQAGTRVRHAEQLEDLKKIYVRVLEYGLVGDAKDIADPRALRACGAALLSSLGELREAAADGFKREAFDWTRTLAPVLDYYNAQEVLYVVPSLSWFLPEFAAWARHEQLLP